MCFISGQIFACNSRRPHFDALAGGDPLRIFGLSLRVQKLVMIVLSDSKDRMIVSSFFWTKHRNVTDRGTDRQKGRGYYSAGIARNVDAL